MTDQVSSRFSILSSTLDSAYVSKHFSWPITETAKPNDQYLTLYDLEVGEHHQVREHLEAVKLALLQKEEALSKLMPLCSYALWINYSFSNGKGAFNLSPYTISVFSLFRLEVIFHLNEF